MKTITEHTERDGKHRAPLPCVPWSTLRDALLTFLYPSFCRVCGSLIESWNDGVACRECWLANRSEGVASNIRDASLFVYSDSCGPYEGAWRETVLHLKKTPEIASRIRTELSTKVEASGIDFDCVIPVPLHPARERERGFNQAAVIARAIARSTGLRLNETSLIRAKATLPHRAGTNPKDRARSLRDAFRVRAPRLIESRTVLLVDDVTTTGATASEATNTLLAAGASSIGFLTIARVTGERPLLASLTSG